MKIKIAYLVVSLSFFVMAFISGCDKEPEYLGNDSVSEQSKEKTVFKYQATLDEIYDGVDVDPDWAGFVILKVTVSEPLNSPTQIGWDYSIVFLQEKINGQLRGFQNSSLKDLEINQEYCFTVTTDIPDGFKKMRKDIEDIRLGLLPGVLVEVISK